MHRCMSATVTFNNEIEGTNVIHVDNRQVTRQPYRIINFHGGPDRHPARRESLSRLL